MLSHCAAMQGLRKRRTAEEAAPALACSRLSSLEQPVTDGRSGAPLSDD